MRITKGICKDCGKETYIANKFYSLCKFCNQKRLNEGKEKKPKNKINSVKRKATGEKELFLKIWEERPHFCVMCGKWLGHEPKTHYFSHIKAKSVHPELRLEESNIQLLCFDCHYKVDFR